MQEPKKLHGSTFSFFQPSNVGNRIERKEVFIFLYFFHIYLLYLYTTIAISNH